jgi:hypothetical protein
LAIYLKFNFVVSCQTLPPAFCPTLQIYEIRRNCQIAFCLPTRPPARAENLQSRTSARLKAERFRWWTAYFAFCHKRTSVVKRIVVKCQNRRELSHEQKFLSYYLISVGGVAYFIFFRNLSL